MHWFVICKPIDGTMYMGNDSSLFVDGISNIVLRMSNGIVKDIKCWHVPQMKRNIISPSTLDSQGYRPYRK